MLWDRKSRLIFIPFEHPIGAAPLIWKHCPFPHCCTEPSLSYITYLYTCESDYGLSVLKIWLCHSPRSYNFSLSVLYSLFQEADISNQPFFQFAMNTEIHNECFAGLFYWELFPRIPFSVWLWVELARSEVVRDLESRNEAGNVTV